MNSLTNTETSQERNLIPITLFVIVLHMLVFFLSDNYTDTPTIPKVKERLVVTTIELNETKALPKPKDEPILVKSPTPEVIEPLIEPIPLEVVAVSDPKPITESIAAMVERQPEPVAQPKPEPIPQPEPTPAPKPEPKPLPKPEPKPISSPKPKPAEASKPTSKAQPKPQQPAKPKPQPEPIKKKESVPAKKVEKKPAPPIEKKSTPAPAVKQDPPKAVVKKEVQKTAVKKEPVKQIPDKKPASPSQPSTPKIDPEVIAAQEAAKAKRQALLSNAQKSIAKIERTHDKLGPSTEITQAAPAIPRPIENLQIENLVIEKPQNLTPQQIGYHEELASRLKLLLRLPDFGEVKIKLTVERSGQFVKVAVVSAESVSNRKYLEKILPTLKFPGFGNHFGSVEQYTFAIALSNDY